MQNVKHMYMSCQRHDAQGDQQVMAPLSQLRVNPAPPFAITGLDHASPLIYRDCPGKIYILLFTCAVTCVRHLELVSSLSGDENLLAFRRFISRRRMPALIMSDNFKEFKSAAAAKEFRVSGLETPSKFIAPDAP